MPMYRVKVRRVSEYIIIARGDNATDAAKNAGNFDDSELEKYSENPCEMENTSEPLSEEQISE